MKHLVRAALVAGLALSSGALHAKDIEQGTIAISGDLDLSFASNTLDFGGGAEVDTDTTALSAAVLYFVSKNFGVGLTWDYQNEEASALGQSAETTVNMFGPAAGFNISVNENTSFQLIGAIVYASVEDKDGLGTLEADGWGFTAMARLSHFLNDHVSVDGSLSYSFVELEDDFNNSADLDGIRLGLGLTVYIP